ncbi:hypothetical protein AVEN_110361-1 [Araneus ventricosus]|uniref:Uncharacterized protein n=1 Tax=Araneus ventricosus TaxID=182803 RepID=A0A4Y2ELW4_ARAVE|nr:hypothetical protein AVEN_110361-1 [Araneus ventricosus]
MGSSYLDIGMDRSCCIKSLEAECPLDVVYVFSQCLSRIKLRYRRPFTVTVRKNFGTFPEFHRKLSPCVTNHIRSFDSECLPSYLESNEHTKHVNEYFTPKHYVHPPECRVDTPFTMQTSIVVEFNKSYT